MAFTGNYACNAFKVGMLNGTFNSGFSLALMKKDLETANRFIGQVDSAAEFSGNCLKIWVDANTQLQANADHTMMYQYIQKK